MTGFKSKRLMATKGGWYNPAFNMAIDLPKENWPDELYGPDGRHNLPYGWAGELTYINTMGFDLHAQLYRDMVDHIRTCVKNPEQNVVWNKIGDCIYVMFRKKKDLMWFKIRFGV